MPAPGEHKTVQSCILTYAQEIGWTYVSREEAERRRGFDADGATPEDRARMASLYFDDLLHAQVLALIRSTKKAEGASVFVNSRVAASCLVVLSMRQLF
jgi:type I restriction enzyme, R subunit